MKNILSTLIIMILVSASASAFGIEFFAPRSQSVSLDTNEVTSFRVFGTPEDESVEVSYTWFVDDEQVSADEYYIFNALSAGSHTIRVIIFEPTDPPKEYYVEWSVTVYGGEEKKEEGGGEEKCIDVWECTLWSACSEDGVQTRTCEQIRCPPVKKGPVTERSCTYVPPKRSQQATGDGGSTKVAEMPPVEQEDPIIDEEQDIMDEPPAEEQVLENEKEEDLDVITGAAFKEQDNQGFSGQDFVLLIIALFVISTVVYFSARQKRKREEKASKYASSPTFLQ